LRGRLLGELRQSDELVGGLVVGDAEPAAREAVPVRDADEDLIVGDPSPALEDVADLALGHPDRAEIARCDSPWRWRIRKTVATSRVPRALRMPARSHIDGSTKSRGRRRGRNDGSGVRSALSPLAASAHPLAMQSCDGSITELVLLCGREVVGCALLDRGSRGRAVLFDTVSTGGGTSPSRPSASGRNASRGPPQPRLRGVS